jgi:hypothetical protein
VVDLGDGILGAASGAEAVGTRLEVRLEDRLQHQFQGGLDRPVACGGDPESPQLASLLGDQPFPHGHRPAEPSSLKVDAQLGKERLAAATDRARRDAIHTGRPGAPVAPHPPPGSDQEGGITNKVVEVIEPATGVVGCPSVQLGLDPQYPRLRLLGRRPRGAPTFTGVLLACQHQRCGLAAALGHAAGFPGLGLLRRLRPTPRPAADGGPARRRPGWPAGRATPGQFPRSPRTGRPGRCPAGPRQPRHGYAADLHRGLPADESLPAVGVDRPPDGRALLPGPYPPGWSRF